MQDVRLDMKAHVPQILLYIQDMNEVLKRTSHTSLYSSRILFKHFFKPTFFCYDDDGVTKRFFAMDKAWIIL